MYRAYDRHLYERFTDTPATPKIDPLAADKLDPRVVVHPLLYCPPLPQGVRYLLVRREWPGMRHVQAIGRAGSLHESINLATVRLRARRVGANEVHLLPKLTLKQHSRSFSAAWFGRYIPRNERHARACWHDPLA
jgi:hypothetical protein